MDWFGLWCEANNAWTQTSAAGIMWGPKCVMEAAIRSFPPEVAAMVEVRRFGPEGQPMGPDIYAVESLIS